MKLLLLGFGTVGQGFVQILRDKAQDLEKRYGFAPCIVGAATRSRGTLYCADGLDPAALLEAIKAGSLERYPESAGLARDWSVERLISESGADVLVDALPTDLATGGASLPYAFAAIDAGMHLVFASKGAVAVGYDDLMRRSRAAGTRVLFEGSVMAGTPSLRLGMQALAGCTITAARGILNGTTNYILTAMEAGRSYADVLAEAQKLGYAEADPTADVDGWDAAGKTIIVSAALFGKQLKLDQMDVQGISHLTAADIDAARASGERWKLIAHVTPEGGSVKPMRLPLAHPLAGVSGTTNAITLTTDLLGDVTLIGAGAGGVQTGFALLSDLIDLQRIIFKSDK